MALLRAGVEHRLDGVVGRGRNGDEGRHEGDEGGDAGLHGGGRTLPFPVTAGKPVPPDQAGPGNIPPANATQTTKSIATQAPERMHTAQAARRSHFGASSGVRRQRKATDETKATGTATKLWSRCTGRWLQPKASAAKTHGMQSNTTTAAPMKTARTKRCHEQLMRIPNHGRRRPAPPA